MMNEGKLTGDSVSLLFRKKAGILIIQASEKVDGAFMGHCVMQKEKE